VTIRRILAVSADIRGCGFPADCRKRHLRDQFTATQALSMAKEDQLSPDGPEMDMEPQWKRSLFCLVEAVSETIFGVVAVSLKGGG